MSQVGELLMARRLQLGLTQARVSKELGIDQGHLSKIESTIRNPHQSTVERLCDYYQIDTDMIYHGQIIPRDGGPLNRDEVLIIQCLRNGELERVLELVLRQHKRRNRKEAEDGH